MMMRISFILAFSLYLFCVSAQDLPPKQAYPYSVKQIHSGHSLTDPLFHPHWPGQYVNLMTKLRGVWAGNDIGKSTIPGSPMRWRWNNSSGYPDARHNIDEFELLSITEVAGLCYEGGSTQGWYLDCIKEQREYMSLFVNNAWNNGNQGNGAATLLWTNWVNINDSDGPFREMLDKLGAEWERIQDHANANRPNGAPHVYIIPGHKMMARLYDDVQDGKVPGITQFSQFFSDNIHTNELGAYAITMIHYACIYNKNPLGLPNRLIDNPPAGTPIPSPALAEYLQRTIWEIVTNYPRTGVNDNTSTSTDVHQNQICIFPNPVTSNLQICSDIDTRNEEPYQIFDHLGRSVLSGYGQFIDVEHLIPGIYLLKTGIYTEKFVKI